MKQEHLQPNWQDQLTDKVISPYSEPANYFTEFTAQLQQQIITDALPKTNVYQIPANYLESFTSNTIVPKPVQNRWSMPKIAVAASMAAIIGLAIYFIQHSATDISHAQIANINQIQEADAEAYLLENAEEDIVKTLPETPYTNLENISTEEIDNYLQQEEI